MSQEKDFEKSPMDYLFTQSFEVNSSGPMSPAERIFMKKYMGLDSTGNELPLSPEHFKLTVEEKLQAQENAGKNYVEKLFQDTAEVLEPVKTILSSASSSLSQSVQEKPVAQVNSQGTSQVAVQIPAQVPTQIPTQIPMQIPVEAKKRAEQREIESILAEAEVVSILPELKQAEEVLMVGLYLRGQIFVIPVRAVQEVIPFMPLARVPRAPLFLLGVINLRNRITPIIRLTDFVCAGISSERENTGFFVICEYAGLQIGLHIDKIHTMYKAKQEALCWEVENQLGAAAEFVSGLFVENDKLYGIVSVENIVKKLLCEL